MSNLTKILMNPVTTGNSGTISISALPLVSSGTTFTLSPTFGGLTFDAATGFPDSNKFVTKHEYLVIKEDLLAMSCARFRLAENTGLLNEDVAKLILPEDREMADKIRKYYSAKIIFWTLKEKELSEFRRDLYTFINTTGMQFEEKMVKLAYRLPEFYEYDTTFDAIKEEHNLSTDFPEIDDSRINRHGIYDKEEDTRLLTTIKITNRYTKHKKLIEYWMKDEANRLCLISIEPSNSLKPLWDKEYAKGTLRIHGHYFAKLRNDFPCFDIKRWEIIE